VHPSLANEFAEIAQRRLRTTPKAQNLLFDRSQPVATVSPLAPEGVPLRVEPIRGEQIVKPACAALLSASAALLTALPSAAHHSVAINFERGEPIEIRGVVKAAHMRNPHSQYVVEVPEGDGTVKEWFVEWSDRNSLVRRGVDLDLIKPGDTVTLTLWPSQRLPNVGYFVQAVLADGSIYRDCGFVQYREAVINSTQFRCEEGTRDAPPRDVQ
jgi:hypothetical protein